MGLLDQCDAGALGTSGLRCNEEIGCFDPTSCAVAEDESPARLVDGVHVRTRRAVRFGGCRGSRSWEIGVADEFRCEAIGGLADLCILSPLDSTSEVRVNEYEPVLVEHELAGESAMRAEVDVADDRLLRLSSHVFEALARRMQTKIGDGHPRHQVIDRARSDMESVAADGHRVRKRRKREVTVPCATESFDVSANLRKLDFPFFSRLRPPIARLITGEQKSTPPTVSLRLDFEVASDEVITCVEPIIEAVGDGIDAELGANRPQALRREFDVGDLDSPAVECRPKTEPRHVFAPTQKVCGT
jgi:hypothetical protein